MSDAYPVLYVMVRPLLSMNGGKAEAHSGHAAAQFVFNMMHVPGHPCPDFDEWVGVLGFGTQINLLAKDDDDFYRFVAGAEALPHYGVERGTVVDPTYPYIVDKEIFSLIDPQMHTADAKFVEATGKYTLFRKETTAAWLFGMSDNNGMRKLARSFDLKP